MRIVFLILAFMLCASPAFASVQEAEQAIARQDFVAARKLLEQPAKNGDAVAEDMLGHMLLFGRGGAMDANRAAELLRKAADKGRIEAQNSMGVIYMTGVTGDLNPTEGINWFRKAAGGGHTYAMFNLGRAAEQGLGMPKSADEAKRWYTQAAEKGNESAKQRLEEINREQRRRSGDTSRTPSRGGAKSPASTKDYTADRERAARRATDKTPLPLNYRLSNQAAHASGLELSALRLSPSMDRLEFSLVNVSGERRQGEIQAFVTGSDGTRVPLPLIGNSTAFSLRNQVTKRYEINPELLSGRTELVIEVRPEGQPVLEGKRPLNN